MMIWAIFLRVAAISFKNRTYQHNSRSYKNAKVWNERLSIFFPRYVRFILKSIIHCLWFNPKCIVVTDHSKSNGKLLDIFMASTLQRIYSSGAHPYGLLTILGSSTLKHATICLACFFHKWKQFYWIWAALNLG